MIERTCLISYKDHSNIQTSYCVIVLADVKIKLMTVNHYYLAKVSLCRSA